MALAPQKTRRPPATLILIACCLFSVISMTVWVREGPTGVLHQIHDGALAVIAPLQSFGTAVTSPLRAIGRYTVTSDYSMDDIQAIIDENDRLRAENIKLREFEMENQRLTELYQIPNAFGLEMVGAHIINRSTDSVSRTITINKGTKAGLRVGMPVMCSNGLLGQIDSAGPTSSVVRLINDQRSGVAVYLQSARVEGIMEGSPDGTLYLRYIDLDTEVVPGATVVTSGSGGVYPKGIPVGTVKSVSFLPSDVFQTSWSSRSARACTSRRCW
ncbi:MAG: rod shape-determining protein MreC [Coriobacteriia bacterium]|nr:rod shape-determining protein MreC [Coriobacteriia bacterium]